MDLDKRYKNYSKYVQEVIQFLVKDLDLHDNYILTLDLIADNLELYYNAKEDVKKNGFTIRNERNQTVKNPAIQIINCSQQMLVKLLASFPASPMAKGRIARLNLIDEEFEVDTLDEFLKC